MSYSTSPSQTNATGGPTFLGVKGVPHPVMGFLAHHLQAWVPQRQAEGQAMLLARVLCEAGFVQGADIRNGVAFLAGSIRDPEPVAPSLPELDPNQGRVG